MKLESNARVAGGFVLFSLLLTGAGYALVFFMQFKGGFHFMNLVSIAFMSGPPMLRLVGIAILLFAFAGRIGKPSSSSAPFILAGILIMVGVAFELLPLIRVIIIMVRNFDISQLAQFGLHRGPHILSALLISIFAFKQGRGASSKTMAKVIAGLCLILVVLLIFNIAQVFRWSNTTSNAMWLTCSLLMAFGLIITNTGVATFMLSFISSKSDSSESDPMEPVEVEIGLD